MEINLDDASGVPEPMKAFLVEKDGKHVLDLGKAASEFDAYKGKTLTAQQEAIERRKALKAWESLGETPDAVRDKLSKGADPAIVEQMRKQAQEAELAYKARLSKVIGDRTVSDLKGELAKAGVVPEALEVLATVARGMIQIDDDGDVRIVGQDGKPIVGSAANGGATLADLAAQLAKANPYAVRDAGVGGGGKPPGSNGGQTAGKTMTRSAFDALPQGDRAAFFRSGGKVVD